MILVRGPSLHQYTFVPVSLHISVVLASHFLIKAKSTFLPNFLELATQEIY